MGLGKTQVLMLIVIVVCASYLYQLEEERDISAPPFSEDNDIAEDLPGYNPAVQSLRTCTYTGNAPNVFVLDITYSKIPDGDIGDKILHDLFYYCSCTNWNNSDCYTWTLVVDELDYVKTQEGACGGRTNIVPVFKNPSGHSTVATVYVREGGSFDIGKLDCVYYTVNRVLENTLSNAQGQYTEVITVLANELEKISYSIPIN